MSIPQNVQAEVTRREVQSQLQREQAAVVAALKGDPDEQRMAEAEVLRSRAISLTHSLAEQATAMDQEYKSILDDARSIKVGVEAGTIAASDAVAMLRDSHNRLTRLTSEREGLAHQYATAQSIIKDAESERDRLVEKYPALRST